MADPSRIAVKNQLLSALPPDVQGRLLPRMRPFTLRVRESLFRTDQAVDGVYFVESGCVSLVTLLEDGSQSEVGLVGREGMVGISLMTGADISTSEAFVQGDGTAFRMDGAAFRHAIEQEPAFRKRLFLYLEAMIAQIVQTAACNSRHDLEQRFARWLLMAHDRSENEDLQLTQEFLATMLGVHRPSVSIAASTLRRAGLIRYGRGHISVLDREALEAASCDCYLAVKKRTDRLLGP